MSAYIVQRGAKRHLQALSQSAILMMFETEGVDLEEERVQTGVARVLSDESLGYYVVAETTSGDFAGSLFVNATWMDLRCGYYWWVHCVHVRAAFRGQGVYDRMYEFVTASAEENGEVVGIRLCVHRDNTVARRAYERSRMKELPYVVYQEKF